MKKLIISGLVLVVLTFFMSCTSDDDANSNELMVGTWKLTEINMSEAYDVNGDGIANEDLLLEVDCQNNEIIEFSSNNTAVISTTSFTDIYASALEGTENNFVFEVDCFQEVDSFTIAYQVVGNTVVLGDDEFDTVGVLNNDTYSFLVEDAIEFDFDDNSTMTATGNVVYVFTRQ